MIFYRGLMACVLVCMLHACTTKPDTSNVYFSSPQLYISTVKQLNNIVLENNFPPMIASRNYAYANIAAYEVMAAVDSVGFQSLYGQIKHFPRIPLPQQQVNTSLAALLAFCKVGSTVTFPEGSMDEYVSMLLHHADSLGMPIAQVKATQQYAGQVADTIIAWSKKDNYAKLRSAAKFTVLDEEGRWQPTPPMYAQAVEPHWRSIRTLVLDSASQCKPVPPPAFNVTNTSSVFYKEVKAVMEVGDSALPQHQEIAMFWDDNPFKMNVTGHVMYATKKFSPPGHWMNIVGIACKNNQANFAETIAAYAQSAIALFDAFISCWDEKYRSNYVRPETVINKYFNANWQPFIQTPPFPEYTSGHAVISAAVAQVLTSHFGNKPFTDSSQMEFGIGARSFTSFTQAAQEAGVSRFYGGIHYKNSCTVGTLQGEQVGKIVTQRLQLKMAK